MAIERALDLLAPELVVDNTQDISTEIVIETDLESGETEISIGDYSTSELMVPHGANLADNLVDTELSALASELVEAYDEDRSSGAEWETALVEGMDILGIRLEDVSEPFEGACGAHHPMLLEACLQFQARAVAELCPAPDH